MNNSIIFSFLDVIKNDLQRTPRYKRGVGENLTANNWQGFIGISTRMPGKNACWVPGTDHASIATETKIVNKLIVEGVDKYDLTRDKFLKLDAIYY